MSRGCVFDSNIIIYRINDRLGPAEERIVSELLDGPKEILDMGRVRPLR